MKEFKNVLFHKNGKTFQGNVQLTTHHVILVHNDKHYSFAYSLIYLINRKLGSVLLDNHDGMNFLGNKITIDLTNLKDFVNIKILCKNFFVFSIDFSNSLDSDLFFNELFHFAMKSSINDLLAFSITLDDKIIDSNLNNKCWNIYKLENEFSRQGLFNNNNFRISNINKKYSFCKTYPSNFIIPSTISDNTLLHASKFRSKNRIPVLSYYYKQNNRCIIRSSQPLVGLTQKRSIHDELLIKSFFNSSNKNLIVDARPYKNAYAQFTIGGGTEILNNYKIESNKKNSPTDENIERIFLGIDNIHLISNTYNFLLNDIFFNNDINLPINNLTLNSNQKYINWINFIKLLLQSATDLTKSIVLNDSNILIHCSDGWDRTTQVSTLLQICIDPYFRTLEGFIVLIEKEWLSFGHKFLDRSNHLNLNLDLCQTKSSNNSSPKIFQKDDKNGITSANLFGKDANNFGTSSPNLPSKNFFDNFVSKFDNLLYSTINQNNNNDFSPIFHQFLDCIYQLLHQLENMFEFNEYFIRTLVYHLYSCKFGTFLTNTEKDRQNSNLSSKTLSIWYHFLSPKNKSNFINKNFDPQLKVNGVDWILPDFNDIKWWYQLYDRTDNELNCNFNKIV